MANLKSPSLTDIDSAKQSLARQIVKYAKMELIGFRCAFEISPKSSCSEKHIKAGHLFKRFPLNKLNINREYLLKGYAAYLPCDTLYMDDYSKAGERAMNDKRGLWKPFSVERSADYFNRMRTSFWMYQMAFDVDKYYPIFGINYRKSRLYSIYNKNNFHFNLSGEAGTFVYFALPYGNLGPEMRYRRVYARAHYDILIPFFFFVDQDDIENVDFWGLDLGVILPLGKRNGVELELNIKGKDDERIVFLSINLAVY